MSAVNDGRCSPWVMCSCSVVSGNQIRDSNISFPHTYSYILHRYTIVTETYTVNSIYLRRYLRVVI